MIKRAETLSRHRGEWALPGGSKESKDKSLLDTALRETEEEIGISRDRVEVWGPLDAVITGTGYVVWPFGGLVPPDVRVTPDSAEVADVIRMPLHVITEPKSHRTITRLDSATGREFGAFSYGGRIIWGATARMLFQVTSMLRQQQTSLSEDETLQGRRAAGGNVD